MKEAKKVEWNDLRSGGYYKIIWKDEEMNVPDEEYHLDPFNVYCFDYNPNDYAKKYGHELKVYDSHKFYYLICFNSDPGINEVEIKRENVKEILELSHDDLIFEIIKIWLEKQENVNKPLLIARITSDWGEDYLQLHFKAIYNDEIQIIACMSKFFTRTYEILSSSAIENAIMIEIPLIRDNT